MLDGGSYAPSPHPSYGTPQDAGLTSAAMPSLPPAFGSGAPGPGSPGNIPVPSVMSGVGCPAAPPSFASEPTTERETVRTHTSHRTTQSLSEHRALVAVIRNHIYVGSAADVADSHAAEQAGVTALLNVADNAVSPEWAAQHIHDGNVKYLNLPLSDSDATKLVEHLPTIFRFVDDCTATGHKVAVYCRKGISRSVAVVMALIMRRREVSSPHLGAPCAIQPSCDRQHAVATVQAVRPQADPNVSFQLQLDALCMDRWFEDASRSGPPLPALACPVVPPSGFYSPDVNATLRWRPPEPKANAPGQWEPQ